MTRCRFLLLGAGFFARKWLEAMKARDDCEVIGVASRGRLNERSDGLTLADKPAG